MKRTLTTAALLALFAFLACVPEEDENLQNEFQQALPVDEAVKIDVPTNEGALTLGEMAPFYQLTRGVSIAVNSRVVGLIAWLRVITLFPASENGEDYAVWGPTEPKGLEVASWQLRVTKLDETPRYSFDLEARAKGAEGEFLPIITGEVSPGAVEGKGKGTMMLFFDNSKTLHIDECGAGQVEVAWDATQATRSVDVHWMNFVNSCDDTELTDATYAYTQDEDFAGTFEFVTVDDMHNDDAKPLPETITMRSRWDTTGHGRSDVLIEGTEIAADLAAAGLSDTNVKATQCWDELFLLTYMDSSPNELEAFIFAEDGDVASCAPFDAAEYPSL